MTLASHEEGFQIPFGELSIDRGEVVDYREKPEFQVRVSSGIAVMSPAALEAIPEGRPFGLTDLFHSLRARGLSVGAFSHAATWIDVNTLDSVRKADRLVAEHPDPFERWLENAPTESRWAMVTGRDGLLVAPALAGQAAEWSLPSLGGAPRSPRLPLAPHLSLIADGPAAVLEFDDLDSAGAGFVRHRVFALRVEKAEAARRLPMPLQWVGHEALDGLADQDPVLRRVVRALLRLPYGR